MKNVYILSGARTPFATWASGKKGDGGPGGALKEKDAYDLGAAAVRGALERAGVAAAQVERVVFSNAYYADAHGVYSSRYVALRAGIPPDVPAAGVQMACASGLYALIAAGDAVAFGQAGLVVTGGTDNVSRLSRSVFIPSFNDISCGMYISQTVESLAPEFAVTREAQDQWAFRSHQLAREAQKAGRFKEEIVPVGAATEDDYILGDPSLDFFKTAQPLKDQQMVTVAATHGFVDGASALIFGSEEKTKAWGREPLGRLVGAAIAATPPAKMAWASVPAVTEALARAKLDIAAIDLFEINETFAAQALVDIKALGIDPQKVNVNGGAVAIGHPFAGSGGRLVLTLLLELKRRGLKRGVAAISAGGGQAAAVVVERI
ncbi:MAG: thiolase family protein [Elusimicrobia bacterium]|nr:thiolase family protein [Elusimicrobiota bacterium]